MLRRLREIDPALPMESAVPTEARILDYGERDMVRPGGKPVRRRTISPERKRYLVLVVACLLTGASVWAWSQPKAAAAPTAGARFAAVESTPSVNPPAASLTPSDAAAAAATTTGALLADPAATPTPASTPRPSASSTPRSPMAGIYAIGGWVRRVDVPSGSAPALGPIGPDGKIYVAGTVLDRDGKVSQAVRHATPPQVFDVDGTAYGVDNDQETATIWATGPDGAPGFTHMLAIQEHVDLRISAGTLIATYPVSVEGERFTQVLQFDRSGTVLENWRMPGLVPVVEGQPQLFIRPNGNLLAQLARGDECRLDVFTPAGWMVSSADCWQSVTQGPDGTLAGWSCYGVQGGTCVGSLIAVLGEDGSVAKGWPKRYDGNSSIPAVGPDGIFFVVSPGPSDTGAIQNSAILAFNRAGQPLRGWPIGNDRDPGTIVFDGCSCSVLPSVAVGRQSGLVILETDQELDAWDRSGKLLTAWSINTAGSPIGAPIVAETGDVLFIASADRIEALKPVTSSGTVAQFVDQAPDKVSWLGWRLAPDGIVAFAYHSNRDESYVMVGRLDVLP